MADTILDDEILHQGSDEPISTEFPTINFKPVINIGESLWTIHENKAAEYKIVNFNVHVRHKTESPAWWNIFKHEGKHFYEYEVIYWAVRKGATSRSCEVVPNKDSSFWIKTSKEHYKAFRTKSELGESL